ncbi:cytochrome c-type biogenesis protein CcmH [bacterium]|nr:cytochrome c-type biogenesis protein CcmH [bacterium]
MKKYSWIWLIFLVSFALVSFVGITYAQGSAHSSKLSGEQAVLFSEISEELMCQCGCNLVLGQCGHVNCPSAVPMREKIEEMILAQKTRTEIMDYFLNEYTFRGKGPFGKVILSQPGTTGFDLMAWVLPFILFALFSVVLFVVVKRATRVNTTSAKNDSTPMPSSDVDRRIEEDLKKLE